MKTVVGLYNTIADANAAVQDLVDYGIARADISLLTSDAAGNYRSALSDGAEIVAGETVDSPADGAATGAGIGAMMGGLGGLLIGLGIVVIPGVGPLLAAGPLATAVAALTGAGMGALAGGAAGGLVGALVDIGVPEEAAGYYAEGVQRGGILVTTQVEDRQSEDVRSILDRHNVVSIDDRGREPGLAGSAADAPVRSYPSDDRFYQYEPDFKQYYVTTLGSRGHDYSYYEPAYHYGYQYAVDDRYRSWTWDDVEPEARQEWERRYLDRGPWEEFKDAVQYAWMRVRTELREPLD